MPSLRDQEAETGRPGSGKICFHNSIRIFGRFKFNGVGFNPVKDLRTTLACMPEHKVICLRANHVLTEWDWSFHVSACIIVCRLAIGRMWLYMACPSFRSSSFVCEFSEQLFSAHPPAPVCSFISSPGLCRLDIGSYLALGHEYACRGLCLHAALVLEQPNHDSLRLEASPFLLFGHLKIRIRE